MLGNSNSNSSVVNEDSNSFVNLDGLVDEFTSGVVSEVAQGSVRAILDSSQGEIRVGGYLLVVTGAFGIVAQIAEMRLAAQGGHFMNVGLRLVASYTFQSGKFTEGVIEIPTVGNQVYRALPALLQQLVAGTEEVRKSDKVSISFATLRDAGEGVLNLSPELLFGRHCAVLGTSGSGKSWTLAKLVEESAKYNSKCILFDASGEYRSLSDNVAHVYLGNHPDPTKNSQEVTLPFYQLKESDLFAIFQPTGQAQAPKLRAAMKSLKLALLSPTSAVDGLISKANRTKTHYDKDYFKHIAEIEKSDCNFDIQHLVQQIQNECVNPYRSATEPNVWGDINALELSYCTPLVNRIQDIIKSPSLEPIFNPKGKSSLLDVIDNFLDHPNVKVLCVSLQYLSFAHSAREIIANATARYMLEQARAERFRKQPLLVVLDEAHQFLNSALETTSRDLSLDAFGMIAKEGRKYSLNICLATQRPRDIPESVLSQVGTFIVHRLINDGDLGVVERAAGGADSSTMAALPALPPGAAVLIGANQTVPLAIRVILPTSTPRSEGPDYQKFWAVEKVN